MLCNGARGEKSVLGGDIAKHGLRFRWQRLQHNTLCLLKARTVSNCVQKTSYAIIE